MLGIKADNKASRIRRILEHHGISYDDEGEEDAAPPNRGRGRPPKSPKLLLRSPKMLTAGEQQKDGEEL